MKRHRISLLLIISILVRFLLKKLFNTLVLTVKLNCYQKKPISLKNNDNNTTNISFFINNIQNSKLEVWFKSILYNNSEKINKQFKIILINFTLYLIALALFFIIISTKNIKKDEEIHVDPPKEDPEIIKIQDFKFEEFISKLQSK